MLFACQRRVAVVDRPLGQLDALGQIEHCAGLCLGCLACHRVEVRPETVRALALVVIGIGAALVFDRFIRLHRRLDGGASACVRTLPETCAGDLISRTVIGPRIARGASLEICT